MKEIRTKANLSQLQLADKTGIAQTSISRFESEGGNLSPENEAKLQQFIATLSPDPSASDTENDTAEKDAPLQNVIDDAIIEDITNQVIENIDSTIEEHVKHAKIPASELFSSESTFDEMQDILTNAEKALVSEVKSSLRERLKNE